MSEQEKVSKIAGIWEMVEAALQEALDNDVIELAAFHRLETIIKGALDPSGRVLQ